jgi:hypothetical protein
MKCEVREMVPSTDNPDEYLPGRTIELTFVGFLPAKFLVGGPVSFTGISDWANVQLLREATLDEFAGKGGIAGGGVSLGPTELQKSFTVLHFFNVGGTANVSSFQLDVSVPTEVPGYWKKRADGPPAMGSDRDVQRLHQLLDEEKQKYPSGLVRILAVKKWTKVANERLLQELVAESATATGARLQQIAMSTERAQWDITNLLEN